MNQYTKKHVIDKKTKKYKGGKRGYRSKHRIPTNNKTKKGGDWLTRQFKTPSIVKTLNLLFIFLCIYPFANEKISQPVKLLNQARLQQKAPNQYRDSFEAVHIDESTFEQLVEENAIIEKPTRHLNILNSYINRLKICSQENKTLQHQNALYFMDSKTVCKYFYKIHMSTMNIGWFQRIFKKKEPRHYKLEYIKNDSVNNHRYWIDLYKYVKKLLFYELLPYWKKRGDTLNKLEHPSITQLSLELNECFPEDFTYFLTEFSLPISLPISRPLLPNNIRDLFTDFKKITKSRLDNPNLRIPERIVIKSAEENISSRCRYLHNRNYDMMILFEPMDLSLFTNFTDTRDPTIKDYPYQFNEQTFKNIYRESFTAPSLFLIYYGALEYTNSELNVVNTNEVNISYYKMFRVLGAIISKKSKKTNIIDNNPSPKKPPQYTDYTENFHVKRFVSLSSILMETYIRQIFGSSSPEQDICVFNMHPYLREEKDVAQCNTGINVIKGVQFKEINKDIKKIYDTFLTENVRIEEFDYDKLSNNIEKTYPMLRIFDFDNDCAYGINFCNMQYSEGRKDLGLCVQLIIIKKIFDENENNVSIEVKSLVIWYKLNYEDNRILLIDCPNMYSSIIFPIQLSFKDDDSKDCDAIKQSDEESESSGWKTYPP